MSSEYKGPYGERGTGKTHVSPEIERQLIEDYRELCGAESLARYGGAWRLRMREDPRLVQRVIAVVRVMKREGRIRVDAGAAAHDLWKRWKI